MSVNRTEEKMDIRYGVNPQDLTGYDTQALRREFLIDQLYEADRVKSVYSHVDRMVVLGISPVQRTLRIDERIDVPANFGTEYFLQRREAGVFQIGAGAGICTVDGVRYEMAPRDCIYITMGARDVQFSSVDAAQPAKFYAVSAPAHCSYETKHIAIGQAAQLHLGEDAQCNRRINYQFIHSDVLKTCQLMMGMTVLEPGNIWCTMPCHTHERRMEIYCYLDMDEEQTVFHLMGQPQQTRHIVMRNEEAVISPSYSIHSGVGTKAYSMIWAMAGENQSFDDMNAVRTADLR